MRTTPQSPRSRFPKGQPRQSGNHAPHQHPPAPHPPIVVPALPHERHSCEGRNPEGRGAGRLRPPSHPPLPVVGAVREPPVPPQRDPHPTTTNSPRHTAHPPRASFPRSGNPGQGRGAGRLRPPSRPPLPIARALPDTVRPEPVEACPEGTRRGPPPPPPAASHPPSSYRRKPVSRGAWRGASPSPHPVAGALPESVRPEPVLSLYSKGEGGADRTVPGQQTEPQRGRPTRYSSEPEQLPPARSPHPQGRAEGRTYGSPRAVFHRPWPKTGWTLRPILRGRRGGSPTPAGGG